MSKELRYFRQLVKQPQEMGQYLLYVALICLLALINSVCYYNIHDIHEEPFFFVSFCSFLSFFQFSLTEGMAFFIFLHHLFCMRGLICLFSLSIFLLIFLSSFVFSHKTLTAPFANSTFKKTNKSKQKKTMCQLSLSLIIIDCCVFAVFVTELFFLVTLSFCYIILYVILIKIL